MTTPPAFPELIELGVRRSSARIVANRAPARPIGRGAFAVTNGARLSR